MSVGNRLSGKDFINAFLTASRFDSQNLSNSNFSGVAINRSTMTAANLAGSNFTNADFAGVDMTGATTTGATFTGVIWSNTISPPSHRRERLPLSLTDSTSPENIHGQGFCGPFRLRGGAAISDP
ncbi:pentapeptide repeat-containing protein [Streptomyces sp. NPDC058394]|uniref:pentapeptide repeat-containing protein n=1 Tax=Streptomyces sp. NPDC058394 TaxID=3346477 RepID=UPI0036621FB9